MKSHPWKIIATAGKILAALYFSTYVVLSFMGRYEVVGITLKGDKSYRWAPKWFCDDHLQWNYPLMKFFVPAYAIDTNWWHTSARAHSGDYPRHR